jgi:hypothetical protein
MAINMHFHDRWDWIMMVVEKITGYMTLEISYCLFVKLIDFTGKEIKSNEEKTLILNVYNACYQHIKKIKDEAKTEHCPDSPQQTEA